MKTKVLKLALTLVALLFIGCSLDSADNNSSQINNTKNDLTKKTNEITNTITPIEDKKGKLITPNMQDSSQQRGMIDPAGQGDLVYYRISFYDTISPFDENNVNQNFSNTTNYTSFTFITSEPHTFIWIFYDDEQAAIDTFISNNTTHIEESVEPTVFKITYDSSLTQTDKDTIKGEFNFLMYTSSGSQNETWVYRDCCVNGQPCDKFVDPFYAYYGLVSEQIIQW